MSLIFQLDLARYNGDRRILAPYTVHPVSHSYSLLGCLVQRKGVFEVICLEFVYFLESIRILYLPNMPWVNVVNEM
jgi:hypothetical protein